MSQLRKHALAAGGAARTKIQQAGFPEAAFPRLFDKFPARKVIA